MASLKGIYGDTKGLVFELTKDETTIGRHGANMMVINDPSVSAFHCSIVKDGAKYTVRDLDSTNGTRLNNEPVKVRRLTSGNIIAVGNVELLFEGEDVEAEDSAPQPVTQGAALSTAPVIPPASPPQSYFKPARRGSNKVMWVVIGAISLVAAALVAWFLISLTSWK